MPLNLPIELVRQILVALGPCSLNPADRQDATRKTLSRCCLASKALKAVAQPLLYQAVLLRKENSVYKFTSTVHGDSGPELAQLVEAYKMPSNEMWTDEQGYAPVRKLVTKLSELRRLWMSGQHSSRRYPSTGWADFAMLTKLESLTLTAVRLSCYPTSSFRNLAQLAFVDVYVSEQDVETILHPDITPNLRAVHLGALYDPNAYYDEAYLPIIPLSSLDRLDILQLFPSSDLPHLPYLFEPGSQLDNVAVQFYTTADLPYLDPSALQHILLLWPSTIPYRQNIKPYRALTTLLYDLRNEEEAVSPHLRSISLPLPLRPIPGEVDEASEGVGTEGEADEARQEAEDPSDGPLALSQEPEAEFDDSDEAWEDEDDEDGEAGYSDSGDESEEEVRYIADPDEVGLTGHENWLLPPRDRYDRTTYRPSPGTQRRVRQILDFAAAHNVDIVWHDWNPRASDSMVCEDFWRYVREKKAGTWRG